MDEFVETTLRQRFELYRFLGSAFVDELSEETLETLASEDEPAMSLEPDKEAVEVGVEPLDGSMVLKAFRTDLGELNEAERVDLLEDMAEAFDTLFRRNTPASVDPYESHYRNDGQRFQASYRDVQTVMDESGYDGYEDHPEPSDHVGNELDFLAYLNWRALEQYQDDNVEATQRQLDLQAEFLESHIGNWVPTFCDAVEKRTNSEFYEAIARMTRDLVNRDPQMIATVQSELVR